MIANPNYKPVQCKGHTEPVSFVAWSPNDAMLLTCSNDKQVRLWNPHTGKCKRTFANAHTEPVAAVAWFPDNKHFVSAGTNKDNTIRKWNINGEQVSSWKAPMRIQDLALSSDGKRLVVISPSDRKVLIYDPDTAPQQQQPGPIKTLAEYDNTTSISLSPCGRYLLVSLSRDDAKGCIRLWDLDKGRVLREYSGHTSGKYVVRSAFGSVDNSLVVSGSEDCKVYIYQRQTAQLLGELSGHVGSVNTVCWNPQDYRMLASGSDDNTVRIWVTDTQT
eukprot:GEZU01024000.1.p1 GENE.GEZU01024000.1~~GEZU01024000.1.p1  ORF type:complete len:275 (+),score=80.79 GEZU01024000.1:259-1083(+)